MRKRAGKRIRNLLAGIWMVLLLICVTAGVQAKTARTVKVAFFPMAGFHEYAKDGSRIGMDVEYLAALNEFAGWDIHYVDCKSWDEALAMLQEGTADLVGSAQYSEERAKIYQYADFPSGYTFGAIMVQGDSTCAYEDFEVMKELTYGVVKTYIRKGEFLEYLQMHGIEDPSVKEFDSTAELLQALKDGEVDAAAHTYMELEEGQRIIGQFAPAAFYYISGKGKEALMEELNQAISRLKMQNPALENTLMSKYYSSKLDQTQVLTTAEKAYVAGAKPVIAGYVDGYYPFSYEKDGEYCGLSRDAFDEMTETTGLSVAYQKQNTMQEALDALKEGRIDVLTFCMESGEALQEMGLRRAVTYASVSMEEFAGQAVEEKLAKELDQDCRIQVIVRADAQEEFSGVLDKGIQYLDERKVNEYIMKHPQEKQMTVAEWIREHSRLLLGAVILVVTVILLVVLKLLYDSKKMQQLLYRDAELGIWNLNYFTYKGERLMAAEARMRYAVVYSNVVQFRTYSTLYGWQAGNQLLQAMAGFFAQNVEDGNEIYARSQGDRFVMLLTVRSRNAFMQRLQRLERELEQKLQAVSGTHMVVCMGVYYFEPGCRDIKAGIDMANQALEYLRDSSVSQIRVYDDNMEEMVRRQHEQEKLLEQADITKDFTVYYQEKVDIRSGKIIGAEALVRFLDPNEEGRVRSPGFFIPYYEKTGWICQVDFFVLNRVCALLRRQLDAGQRAVPVSCNFSRRHFAEGDFPERLEAVLQKYQIPKELIEVEITETIVIEEIQQQKLKGVLEQLQNRGIRLSIDDFGSGYSSLGIFEQVPASVIKLDRSFLLNNTDRTRQIKIMRQIVSLAETLDAQVVCEGVENERDVELMSQIGAYVAQGFYYARPEPEKIFEAKLAASS